MSFQGIDVSGFQGNIDWESVKRDGIEFAMLRAGYGAGNPDPQFRRNARECSRLEIPFGVYWFSYAYTARMASQEADYCIDALREYKVQYPVAFDFEQASITYARRKGVRVGRSLATQLVEAFCGRVEELGYYAMYYSDLSLLRTLFDEELRRKYSLWYAQYARVPAVIDKDIWQYTSSGRVDGIRGRMDRDISYVDFPSLIADKGLNHLDEPKEDGCVHMETSQEDISNYNSRTNRSFVER